MRAVPVDIESRGAVMVLRLNRPAVSNAVDAAVSRAIAAGLDQAATEDQVRAVIITGVGNRAFCAGADLKALARGEVLSGPAGEPPGFAGLVSHPITKPLIAAVNGAARGGGVEIVLACDLAVAAEHATFALPETTFGRIAGAGGAFRLPAQVARKGGCGRW
jgi:crotonobetainyl-CoA hydratase